MDRHTVFSIILLAIVFLAGFSIGYFSLEKKWQCSICSFNPADPVVPLANSQYSDYLYSELQGAEKEIDVVIYEMKFYATNNSVRKAENLLAEKAEQGIKVKVLFDRGEWQGQTTELTKENQKTADYLKSRGVEVKFDDKKTTTHDKLVIIDGKEVFVGSHNWGYSAFERNNEASVLIKDADVAEYYQNYFNALWDKY